MHPEVVQSGPGDCPICGMALEHLGMPSEGTDDAELRDMTRRLIVAALLTLRVKAAETAPQATS
jgi:Cu+-exporting ATPase